MNLHPITKKKLKHQQSINAPKDEINILEERQKHWLTELHDHDKNTQQFVETVSLRNNDKESIIAKYRSKVKEDETRNVSNWSKHFDKLKETYSEEQDSNEIDNLLKYAGKPPTNEPITQPQSTKILNLSNVPLTQEEIDILKLGLSFTPTPKQNIAEPENDIFQFIRKLRLTYHYRNSNIADESIVKLESTYTPKPNENAV